MYKGKEIALLWVGMVMWCVVNKNIKGREVALLWVRMMMWSVVNKNIKEDAKGSYCICFAPYNIHLLPLLLSKRIGLPSPS